MKSKRLFQIFVVFALLFSSFGGGQPVYASVDAAPAQDPIVINRSLDVWNATYIGFVSDSIHEKWQLDLTEAHNFVVSANTVAGDLVPLLILRDVNGVEITRGVGSLTSSQSAGTFFIEVLPDSGAGFYFLTIRQAEDTTPSASTVVNPTSVDVGGTATVTVNLNNVPASGYTSAEFTCTYDPALVQVSNIVATSLFGADPAVAINDPQNGTFIVAIAGANGNKATTSGAAFTFTVTALQAGQVNILCVARVSTGTNVLTSLPSTGSALTITGTAGTATPVGSPQPTATTPPLESPTPTAGPVESPTPTAGPVESPTPTASPTAVESPTPVESPAPVFTATPVESPTPTFTFTPESSPTPTTSPDGTLTGQVTASKPVTVTLYSGNVVVATVNANPDGTFSITAPAGSYTVVASASGFLSAQGSANITPGGTTPKPAISLLAGDIDANNVIDQFDALTIGINYNLTAPAAADLNNDGVINVLDLELLAQNYRDTGPTSWE